jgi:hypothetical protein
MPTLTIVQLNFCRVNGNIKKIKQDAISNQTISNNAGGAVRVGCRDIRRDVGLCSIRHTQSGGQSAVFFNIAVFMKATDDTPARQAEVIFKMRVNSLILKIASRAIFKKSVRVYSL